MSLTYFERQVFPMKALSIFTEEDIESLVCGEQNSWTVGGLPFDFALSDGGQMLTPIFFRTV